MRNDQMRLKTIDAEKGIVLIEDITGEDFSTQDFPKRLLDIIEGPDCKNAKIINVLLDDVSALYKVGTNRVVLIHGTIMDLGKEMVFICPGMCENQIKLLKGAMIQCSEKMI